MKRMLAAAVSALFLAALSISPAAQAQPATAPAAKPMAKPATTPAATPAAPAATAKRKPSAGMLAARERQKKCGAEWREAKAAGKIAAGQKWPQYWSACNKRLKGAGA